METTTIKHIAEFAEILSQNGINDVVVSPGSRNAPLIIAFDNHDEIQIHLIHDERSAAFFALGLSEEKKIPVAIVCTSGSASLNYAPAVAEAYYRQIPMLVLTADRPSHLINQGDGQCIRQDNIYHNYSKGFFQLPEAQNNNVIIDDSNTIVFKVLTELLSVPFGPVHLNIPLHEPLYETEKKINTLKDLSVSIIQKNNCLSEDELFKLKKVWAQTEKKLIIIGQLSNPEDVKVALASVAQNPSVAVLVENTSNLQDFYKFCHCIDRTLAVITEKEIEKFKPDLILNFGGAIVSKKIKTFLRTNQPTHNWRVGHYLINEDTFFSKTETIKTTPEYLLGELLKVENFSLSNYGNLWKSKDFTGEKKHQEFLANASYSDLSVIDYILDTVPGDSVLQMANSSVVRYCQLFNPIQQIKYYANRGVSGIDGSTSTAVGMATANPKQLVTFITGDISFFYDSNGLWNTNLPPNLRIVLINNGGGGIFNILEGSRKSKQNEVFVANHKAKAKGVCLAFGVDYHFADSMTSLESIIKGFYNFSDQEAPKLLEVDTSSVENHSVLMSYFKFIAI